MNVKKYGYCLYFLAAYFVALLMERMDRVVIVVLLAFSSVESVKCG
jgi:hypothetical protein